MNKLLIGGLAAFALALAGCTTAVEPAPEVAQTLAPEMEAPAPSPAPELEVTAPELENSYSESSDPADVMFMIMMEAVDTPSYFLEGDTLYILQDQAKSTCKYIREGMSKDDVVLALTLAIGGSDAGEEVTDAFMAATVASVYSYCPEHKGFWD
jgi:hypothetical protein